MGNYAPHSPYPQVMNIQKFLLDLEIILEKEELKKAGLSEEEIQGYFEFYADNWIKKEEVKDNKYAN